MKKFGVLAGAAALAVTLSLPGARQAEAALVACPTGFVSDPTSKVTSAGGATAVNGCQYITPPDPSSVANLATINGAGFFGFTDWQSNAQDQINVTAQTGSWSIANVDFAANDYIIVFKDGAGTNLTAFSFNELISSGTWRTPFTDPPFNLPGMSTSADVSHYTIAFRSNPDDPGTNPDAIPEPMTLALFGLGLAGLGAVARRRRAA
jgi:hypothetical protein